ncbi:zona pellucida sperm-binding protein 3-like isoform X2 [Falco rusticolus]|uniref:zona pellucida sperm-binding protein 3-like isoform X2 n=1 Tax=Falco rusticolus TaxID=120794 RepID=UPI001886507D|nr:zona pellucida sperm-binding protein 3-like isoform X2 [Falco rusticolus]
MKAFARGFVLALVAAAWAQDALVSVTCGHMWLSVVVPAGLLGSRVTGGELTLGSSCGVTAADQDGYRLEHPLEGCGTTLQLLPDSIHYSNVLHYHPLAGGAVARARPFSLPVDCYYPRMGSVSSRAIQPTWVPFGSTIAHQRPLRFALDVYDSTWSSRLLQPTYSLGDLINIEASVRTDPRLPLRVFVDECVASPSAAAQLKYKVIADNGCLRDGQLGRSRFLPQRGDRFLRFQLDTFLFPNSSGSQIYLRCHLKAVAEGAASTAGKACSYDRVAAAWHSLDGADCSCCGSPAGCGGRRRRWLPGSMGLLGEASIRVGPLGLLSALPGSSPVPTELPTAPEPSMALPPHPSIPVVRGEKRDSDHPDHDRLHVHRLRDRPDHAHQRLHLRLRHRRDPLPGRRVLHHLRLPLHRGGEEPHRVCGKGQPDHEHHQRHLRSAGHCRLHRRPQPERAVPLQLRLLQLSHPGNGISIVLLIFTILEFCIAVATANFWCRATRLSSNEAMLIVPSTTRVDLAVPPADLPQPPSYTELAAPEV